MIKARRLTKRELEEYIQPSTFEEVEIFVSFEQELKLKDSIIAKLLMKNLTFEEVAEQIGITKQAVAKRKKKIAEILKDKEIVEQ